MVDHGHVRDRGRLCRVTAQAADQRGGEAGHLLHVGVGGEARRAEGRISVCLYHPGVVLEQGLHAADALFQRGPLADGPAQDHGARQRHWNGHRLCQARQLALDFGDPGGHAVLQLDNRRCDHLADCFYLIAHRLDFIADHILDGHGGDDFLTQRLQPLPQLLRSPVCRRCVKPAVRRRSQVDSSSRRVRCTSRRKALCSCLILRSTADILSLIEIAPLTTPISGSPPIQVRTFLRVRPRRPA